MVSRNNPSLNRKEVDDVSDKELKDRLIQQYTDLQRILAADDPKKEAEYQLKVVKARLESYGTVTEDLDLVK